MKTSPLKLTYGVESAQYHPTLVSKPRLFTSLRPNNHRKCKFVLREDGFDLTHDPVCEETGLVSHDARCVRGRRVSLPQNPIYEGEIVEIVLHQLWKELVVEEKFQLAFEVS